MDTKHTPDPFNGMPSDLFHYHLVTEEGRTKMNAIREAHAKAMGVPIDRMAWRQSMRRAWVYAKATTPNTEAELTKLRSERDGLVGALRNLRKYVRRAPFGTLTEVDRVLSKHKPE